MSALLESSQAMLEGKEEVAAAKADLAQRSRDLGQLLVEADAFLLEERRSRKAARKCAPLHELQGGPCSCLSLPAADSLLLEPAKCT